MFSKTKEPETVAAPQPAAVNKRGVARSTVPSIISADLTVNGTLVSAGDLQIEGHVEGDIKAGSLVIGEKASIDGDLYAEEAAIRGHVRGNIRARKVTLCTTGRVEGNILHEALSMEAGAYFEGNCRHSDNPLAEGADAMPRKGETFKPTVAPAPAMPGAAAKPANGPDDNRVAAPRPLASYTPLKS